MLDHDPEVIAYNSNNCIPIMPFKGDPKDATLLYLEKYLLKLSEANNMSLVIKQDFKDPILKEINS